MALPFFSSKTRYPITLKPITKPDIKDTHTDVFNILNTLRSLFKDIDTLFLGSTLATAPPLDEEWIKEGAGTTAGDASEQSLSAVGTGAGAALTTKFRPINKTTDWVFRAAIHCQTSHKDFLGSGVLLKLPAGAFIAFGIQGSELVVRNYTSPTAAGSVIAKVPLITAYPQWYKIEKKTGEYLFSFCADGESWIQLHKMAAGAHTQAGFWVSSENSATPNLGIIARLFSWRIE